MSTCTERSLSEPRVGALMKDNPESNRVGRMNISNYWIEKHSGWREGAVLES